MISDLKQQPSVDLSLRLVSVISKRNLFERLLKEEVLEELNQLYITRQNLSSEQQKLLENVVAKLRVLVLESVKLDVYSFMQIFYEDH